MSEAANYCNAQALPNEIALWNAADAKHRLAVGVKKILPLGRFRPTGSPRPETAAFAPVADPPGRKRLAN
jgi:hypothetical protein